MNNLEEQLINRNFEKNIIVKKTIKGGVVVGVLMILQYSTLIITQIALARILAPSQFGILAFSTMIAFFLGSFTNLFGDKYLVKETAISDEKINTVITFELIIVLFIFIIVFFSSPFLMKLLGKPALTPFVQFLSISFFYTPLSKLKAVHEREFKFFKANFPTLIGQLLGGLLAITLALKGYGIWSLLWWKIGTLFIELVVLWSISSYIPKFVLNKTIAKEIIIYGKPLLFSSILIFIYANFDYYIIDSLTTPVQLGYYWLAYQVSHYFLNARAGINKVIFPALSRFSDKNDRYEAFGVMTNLVSVLYIIPTIIMLFFGTELITYLYGIKWLPAALIFQIFFITILIKATSSNAGPLLHSEGNTKADLKLSIINLTILVPSIYFGALYYGITGAALGILFVSVISGITTYTIFVKPITGHGFIYYLWKAIFVVCISSLLLYFSNLLELGITSKSMIFLFILILIFYVYKATFSKLYQRCFN